MKHQDEPTADGILTANPTYVERMKECEQSHGKEPSRVRHWHQNAGSDEDYLVGADWKGLHDADLERARDADLERPRDAGSVGLRDVQLVEMGTYVVLLHAD